MSRKLAQYLLSNLSTFNEIQLPTILNYVELYDPKSDEEITFALNILDSKLRSPSLSVVLSVGKIYLKYGKIKP